MAFKDVQIREYIRLQYKLYATQQQVRIALISFKNRHISKLTKAQQIMLVENSTSYRKYMGDRVWQ